MSTNKALQVLTSLIEDFETGYIANPSQRAQRKRDSYEKKLREMRFLLANLDPKMARVDAVESIFGKLPDNT